LKDYNGVSYDGKCAFFGDKPGTSLFLWCLEAVFFLIVGFFSVLPLGFGWFIVVGLGGAYKWASLAHPWIIIHVISIN
jgi:hypothetical protein